MRPDESYSYFRDFLKLHGRTLKSLQLPDAPHFVFEFFCKQRADGISERMGDGLAYSTDISGRKHGTVFEFSFTRLFSVGDNPLASVKTRLRLSVCFPWTEVMYGANLPNDCVPGWHRLSWNLNDATEMQQQLKSDRFYIAMQNRAPKRVTLNYENSWWDY